MNNIQILFDGQVKQTINSWVSIGSNFAVITEPTNPITSLTMDNPYKISVDWKNQFYLNANSSYGKVEGSGWYDEGDVVVASIDAQTYDSGIVGTRLIFDGWFGDVNSPGMNIQVPMDEPKSIQGIWKKQFLLTVNSVLSILFSTCTVC